MKADGGKRGLQDYRDLTTGLRKFARDEIPGSNGRRLESRVILVRREGSACVEPVHVHVRADKATGRNPWKHCRHQLMHRKRQVTASYTAVQNRAMMDGRPGEWDGTDTIAGKDGKGAILILVGRNTSFMMARKLPKGKGAQFLARTAILMLPPCIGEIRSVTIDNGSGFTGHPLSQVSENKDFLCPSNSPWEKGHIECHDRLIRQHILKETDFNDVSEQMLKEIVIIAYPVGTSKGCPRAVLHAYGWKGCFLHP